MALTFFGYNFLEFWFCFLFYTACCYMHTISALFDIHSHFFYQYEVTVFMSNITLCLDVYEVWYLSGYLICLLYIFVSPNLCLFPWIMGVFLCIVSFYKYYIDFSLLSSHLKSFTFNWINLFLQFFCMGAFEYNRSVDFLLYMGQRLQNVCW